MKVILNELPKEFTTWTQFYGELMKKFNVETIIKKGIRYNYLGIPSVIAYYEIKPDFLKEKLLEELTQSLTTNRIVGYSFDFMDEKFAHILYCVDGNYHTSKVGIYLMTEDEQKRFLSLCGHRMTFNQIGEFLNNQMDNKNESN